MKCIRVPLDLGMIMRCWLNKSRRGAQGALQGLFQPFDEAAACQEQGFLGGLRAVLTLKYAIWGYCKYCNIQYCNMQYCNTQILQIWDVPEVDKEKIPTLF